MPLKSVLSDLGEKRRTLAGIRRCKSVRVLQFDEKFTTSTPKPRRLSDVFEGRKSLSQKSLSGLSIESLNDWSIVSSGRSRTSILENSLKRAKTTRKKIRQKLKLSRNNLHEKVLNRMSKTTIEEINPDYSTDMFNGQICSRIVSVNELPSFEEYDFVVWNVSPEKKKRKFFEFFKRSMKN